jgi:DNA modification methylase
MPADTSQAHGTNEFQLKIQYVEIGKLVPYARHARTHKPKQIDQIASAIRQFGFTNPILIGDDGEIIAGHGRVLAAKQLGMREIPTVCLSHLSPEERQAYRIADNRLAERAGWDDSLLALELASLAELDVDFELEITGFDTAEIDLLLDTSTVEGDEADAVPEPVAGAAITRPGDVWVLGKHRLLCGDATDPEAYGRLLGNERADCVFTDPPYNVKIDGNVCGKGAVRHREFAMASGEMDKATFTDFLTQCLVQMATFSRDGSIHFVCMDWRHLPELLAAGDVAYSELKNLIAWVKSNAGMGTFYRSQHELVLVYKRGTAPHTNTFGLGETGRHRSNVWQYAGVNSFGKNQRDLALHPTVKPVAMVKDAIRDVTKRRELVLDPFGGSGTTLIAAEQTGRVARLMELDPVYCDVICRRFEDLTGTPAILQESGVEFHAVAAARSTPEADDA